MNFKKWFLFGAIVFFVFHTHAVFASFQITEIMYDVNGTDTNREWIEVQNTGNSSDDLSKWYLFSDNTKHTLAPETASMVPAGGYAVIAQNILKFRTDYPDFNVLLFDSSWTGFNNETGTIALKDPDLNLVSSVTYSSNQGASGDGNSLQYINNSWSAAIPTPGEANSSADNSQTVISNNTTSSNTNTSGSTTQKVSATKEPDIPGIYTNILAKNIVIAGIDFPVSSKTTGYSKEILSTGKFVWNFGDGNTRTDKTPQQFNYNYKYSGQYVMTLSYYQYYYSTVADATSRLIITVVPAQISISSVGDSTDPFVQISNTSNYEIPLSGWIIKSVNHSFQIPDGTIILPSKKLIFGSLITSFTIDDIQNVSLVSPNNSVVSIYPSLDITPSTQTEQYLPIISTIKTSINKPSAASLLFPKVVLADSQSASASNPINLTPATADSSLPVSNKIPLFWIGILGLFSAVILSFFLIRKKSSMKGELSHISSEDIKIIE